jgi:tryptophan 2,3-dioxygenase
MIELVFKDGLNGKESIIQDMADGQVADLAARLSFASSKLALAESVTNHLKALTPSGFAEFRSQLGTASGLQSHQFRELELQGGLDESCVPNGFPIGSREYEAIQARKALPSLRSAYIHLLEFRGLISPINKDLVNTANAFANALRKIYTEPELSILREIAEALFEFDDAFTELRRRHLRIVGRTIGSDSGTGIRPW